MRSRLVIGLCMLLSCKAIAMTTVAPDTMTVEQQQQFLYYFYEAERLWQNGQYADAFAMFDFCHELNPADAITNRYLGHVYNGCNLTNQALTYYRRAWEQDPHECWNEYAVTLYNTGETAHRQEAIRVMEQTALTLHQDPDLWDRLRDAYTGVKEYKKAIAAQDSLDKIEGYGPYSAINRYRIYMLMQAPKKAIAAIEDYLKEAPTDIQFQMYRMQLYEVTNQPVKKRIAVYQDILALDPYNALALNNYAYMLATHKGDLHLAEQMSTKAIRLESQNPTYLDTYAWIMHLTGQNELAKLYIRQAINLLGNNPIPQEIQQHYNAIFAQ